MLHVHKCNLKRKCYWKWLVCQHAIWGVPKRMQSLFLMPWILRVSSKKIIKIFNLNLRKIITWILIFQFCIRDEYKFHYWRILIFQFCIRDEYKFHYWSYRQEIKSIYTQCRPNFAEIPAQRASIIQWGTRKLNRDVALRALWQNSLFSEVVFN
jgi:hypothetical protein